MDRGLYIAASGMLAEQVRQDQIANDLANASTPGYKADRTTQRSFGNLLLNNSVTGARVGSQSTAVQVDTITTDFTPEPLKDTGEPLDFGITGDGFFALQTAQGTRYTRNGQFTTNAQGQLTDATGNRVLGRDGKPLTVGADGRVDPRRLNVVLLQNPRKLGDNLVSGTPGNVAGQAAGPVRSGVTSCTLSFSVAPACTSGGTWAVTGIPASTITACCSPREATRAISVAPSRSGTSGS